MEDLTLEWFNNKILERAQENAIIDWVKSQKGGMNENYQPDFIYGVWVIPVSVFMANLKGTHFLTWLMRERMYK